MPLITFAGRSPDVHAQAWLADSATLVGAVTVETGASVWFSSTTRTETESITIGAGSNVQDGCVLHTDSGFPLVVGSQVSVGHGAVLHGCTVGDRTLIGMGAIVMNGAQVGADSIIAAGALVPEGMDVPPGSLVAGVPGRVRRSTTPDERAAIMANAALYLDLARAYGAA